MRPIAVDLKDLRRQLKIVDQMSESLPKKSDREMLDGLATFLSILIQEVRASGSAGVVPHFETDGDEAPASDGLPPF